MWYCVDGLRDEKRKEEMQRGSFVSVESSLRLCLCL